ncbi:MAG: PTS system mannose/fructose/sorbose family transporter subunit IID [Erysipelotrichaceae bacterium]|nr:PTS system mannose/fructose/sorbose family transporter subunit IID [Erysipelotrichaceae bacterium]
MTDNNKKLLSQKDIVDSYKYWMRFALSCQNMERMEAPGFAGMFARVADKLYKDDPEKQKELVKRHMTFYNTQPMVGAIVNGIVLGMEEKKAMGEDVPDELIQSTKTALMGPLAGIGDSLFIGTLIPILLSIGLGLTGDTGSVAGPIFYMVSWCAIMFVFSWTTYKYGYRLGSDAIKIITESEIKDKVVRFASILGLVVTGSVTAQYVNFGITWQYVSGEMTKGVQGVLDGIFPGILPLLLTLICWYMMDKKKVGLGKLFAVVFVIAFVGTFFGLIG